MVTVQGRWCYLPHHQSNITLQKEKCFIALFRWKMIILLPILPMPLIHSYLKGWENVLFALGSERRRGREMRESSPYDWHLSTPLTEVYCWLWVTEHTTAGLMRQRARSSEQEKTMLSAYYLVKFPKLCHKPSCSLRLLLVEIVPVKKKARKNQWEKQSERKVKEKWKTLF